MDAVIYMPDEAKAKVRNLLNQLARLIDAHTLREIEEECAEHFEIVNANIANRLTVLDG